VRATPWGLCSAYSMSKSICDIIMEINGRIIKGRKR
jgi:hypothetical protein